VVRVVYYRKQTELVAYFDKEKVIDTYVGLYLSVGSNTVEREGVNDIAAMPSKLQVQERHSN
jgi:hypothetical protein